MTVLHIYNLSHGHQYTKVYNVEEKFQESLKDFWYENITYSPEQIQSHTIHMQEQSIIRTHVYKNTIFLLYFIVENIESMISDPVVKACYGSCRPIQYKYRKARK